ELDAVFATADQLLKVPGLSDTDREWAMSQKVWVSELKLNFADAYRLSLKMSFPHLSKADRELRLALLAELAGLDARKHNEAILKLSKNTRAKNLVRVSLIRSSGNPWKELDRHRDQLRKTPDLLAG